MKLHEQFSRNIEFLIERNKKYYDRKRSERSDFKKKDPVYLIHKNIKTKRSSLKLDFMKFGLFKISQVIG